ncbi:auxin efflux carrier component 6 isoform X1 [Jatropha curcas]|uniref:auxin efflux carrier component 6 isoform X1 n=1 Tax=Jatropha curcas TaxID=180498 RepID=UPI001893D52A|nr:auxin efflux carrier component 6 isoform X1 [Jatropha curcas]
MITGDDFYKVMCAMVPLYFAMIVAYGSVKWWKIFTPEQCSGINRFVAVFAVPVLSFHFISQNNPYRMDTKFILADTLSKVLVLVVLSVWAIFFNGGLDWLITLFSVATLPNTLVMGIPLLMAMYGDFTQSLMVQVVVLQCIIWYTLLLFLFEYRAATHLIKTQFPGPTAASITKIELDNDVISLDGRDPLRTESETDGNGRIRLRILRSTSSAPDSALSSSINLTPRPSNLSNAEIFSVNTPAPFHEYNINNTSSGYSHYNHGANNEIIICSGDLGFGYRSGTSPRLSGYASSDAYSLQPTPRASNFNELDVTNSAGTPYWVRSPVAGKFFRQQSPAVPEVRMAWGESPGKGQNGSAGGGGGKDITEKEISFRDNCKTPAPEEAATEQGMPSAIVMMRLILIVVGRKLSRNPNTYSSVLGLLWSLISFNLWYFEQMECGNAKSSEILDKNNFRCRSWNGNVQFRVIHGPSTSDNCLWQKEGSDGDGDPIHLRPHSDVSSIRRGGFKRSPATSSYSTGSSSTRDSTICVCKRIWITSRYIKYRGHLWDASFLTGNLTLLHIPRPMNLK